MIFDIDQKNKNYKIMNILQSKWILYIQIQKNISNKKFIILMLLKRLVVQYLNIKIFKIKINIYKKQNNIKIQYNIMIFDIDQKNNNYQIMNILQSKWILYIQIQKNISNKK